MIRVTDPIVDEAILERSYDLERCERDVRSSLMAPLVLCSSTAVAVCVECGTALCTAHCRAFGGADRCCSVCRDAWAGPGAVIVFSPELPESCWDEIADARERRARRNDIS